MLKITDEGSTLLTSSRTVPDTLTDYSSVLKCESGDSGLLGVCGVTEEEGSYGGNHFKTNGSE